ncbi:hypothetical protein [Massilia endophytica]|uniref:hypothetical protein n=1 Tax=Massilia endophytica TaxID=2899220 RepID=UPI001E498BD6|nr:hypothetical protein [Massilia endophytica]UGQ44569.1 hypothetical protein LSQ66_12180 [Massilia endophytica]
MNPSLHWPDLDDRTIDPDFTLHHLRAQDVARVSSCLKAWYPDIGTGAAQGFLDPHFYAENAALAGSGKGKILALLVLTAGRPAAFYAYEQDPDALSLYCRLVVIAPEFRRGGLGGHYLRLAEYLGRRMGLGFLYGLVSMKQRANMEGAEKSGWRLVGIMPGADREQVAPGVVKRVYEAIYAKQLAPAEDFMIPEPEVLSQQGRALAEVLFPELLAPVPERRR